jgi:hypothetical protein
MTTSLTDERVKGISALVGLLQSLERFGPSNPELESSQRRLMEFNPDCEKEHTESDPGFVSHSKRTMDPYLIQEE